MKERYVKVFTGFCWLLVVAGIITIGFFWFQIISVQSESALRIDTKEQKKLEVQKLPFEYWSTKTGSKYYPVHCESAPDIPKNRRIYYASSDEAIRYGKELSVRCK